MDHRVRAVYIVVGAALLLTGEIDQQQTLARPGTAFEPTEPQHLAVVAHALAQGAAEIRPRPAAGAHAAMAASPRQSGRGLAREFAQGFAGRACREAAFDQRLGAR